MKTSEDIVYATCIVFRLIQHGSKISNSVDGLVPKLSLISRVNVSMNACLYCFVCD